MKKAVVNTAIWQVIEVPDDWEQDDVLVFLAEQQSFRDAFLGVSNEAQTARIVDLGVVGEEVIKMAEGVTR
jgi:hypothetical protein